MTDSHGVPDDAGDGAEKTAVQARQGVTSGHVRWMLRISLVLCVLALGGVFISYTASHHGPAQARTAAAAPRTSGAS